MGYAGLRGAWVKRDSSVHYILYAVVFLCDVINIQVLPGPRRCNRIARTPQAVTSFKFFNLPSQASS